MRIRVVLLAILVVFVVGSFAEQSVGLLPPGEACPTDNNPRSITAPDLVAEDQFATSVAAEGRTFVFGAPYDDGPVMDSGVREATDTGCVYVFSGGRWTILDAGQGTRQPGSQFGHSVALDGDTLVIGEPLYDDLAAGILDVGRVHVFTRDEFGRWMRQGEPLVGDNMSTRKDASGNRIGERFGFSVAIDGNTIVVGAPNRSEWWRAYDAGGAYIFERAEGQWSQTRFVAPPPEYTERRIQLEWEARRVDSGFSPPDPITFSLFLREFLEKGDATWSYFTVGKETLGIDPGRFEYGQRSARFGAAVSISEDHVYIGAPNQRKPRIDFRTDYYLGKGFVVVNHIDNAYAKDMGAVYQLARGADGDWDLANMDPDPQGTDLLERGYTVGLGWQPMALPDPLLLPVVVGTSISLQPQPQDGLLLGQSLAAGANGVWVGAPGESWPNNEDAGSIYFYGSGPGGASPKRCLNPSANGAGDLYGWDSEALATSPTGEGLIAVAAPGDRDEQGAVYVHRVANPDSLFVNNNTLGNTTKLPLANANDDCNTANLTHTASDPLVAAVTELNDPLSVALTDEFLISGVPGAAPLDIPGEDFGAAWRHRIREYEPDPGVTFDNPMHSVEVTKTTGIARFNLNDMSFWGPAQHEYSLRERGLGSAVWDDLKTAFWGDWEEYAQYLDVKDDMLGADLDLGMKVDAAEFFGEDIDVGFWHGGVFDVNLGVESRGDVGLRQDLGEATIDAQYEGAMYVTYPAEDDFIGDAYMTVKPSAEGASVDMSYPDVDLTGLARARLGLETDFEILERDIDLGIPNGTKDAEFDLFTLDLADKPMAAVFPTNDWLNNGLTRNALELSDMTPEAMTQSAGEKMGLRYRFEQPEERSVNGTGAADSLVLSAERTDQIGDWYVDAARLAARRIGKKLGIPSDKTDLLLGGDIERDWELSGNGSGVGFDLSWRNRADFTGELNASQEVKIEPVFDLRWRFSRPVLISTTLSADGGDTSTLATRTVLFTQPMDARGGEMKIDVSDGPVDVTPSIELVDVLVSTRYKSDVTLDYTQQLLFARATAWARIKVAGIKLLDEEAGTVVSYFPESPEVVGGEYIDEEILGDEAFGFQTAVDEKDKRMIAACLLNNLVFDLDDLLPKPYETWAEYYDRATIFDNVNLELDPYGEAPYAQDNGWNTWSAMDLIELPEGTTWTLPSIYINPQSPPTPGLLSEYRVWEGETITLDASRTAGLDMDLDAVNWWWADGAGPEDPKGYAGWGEMDVPTRGFAAKSVAAANGTSTDTVCLLVQDDYTPVMRDVSVTHESVPPRAKITVVSETVGQPAKLDVRVWPDESGSTGHVECSWGGDSNVASATTSVDPGSWEDLSFTSPFLLTGPTQVVVTVWDTPGEENVTHMTLGEAISALAPQTDTYTAVEDEPLEDVQLTVGSAEGLLANDTGCLAIRDTGHRWTDQGGRVNIKPDGSFTYTAPVGFFATDTFTYTPTNYRQDASPVEVQILVRKHNDPPIPGDDYYTVNEDEILRIEDAIWGFAWNDADPDGDDLVEFEITSMPSHGWLPIVETDGDDPDAGTFTYIPMYDHFGYDSFEYRVKAGGQWSPPARVSIEIIGSDDPPQMYTRTLPYTIPEDSVLTVSAANGLLSNAYDIDGDPLRCIVDTSIVTIRGDLTTGPDTEGSFMYVPPPGWHGTEVFRYEATDGLGHTLPAYVVIEVQEVNDAPEFEPPVYEVLEDQPLTITKAELLANAHDEEDNTPYACLLASEPVTGTLDPMGDEFASASSYTYMPAPNDDTWDYFAIAVRDCEGATSTPAPVLVDIIPVNDPPEAQPDTFTVDFGVVTTFTPDAFLIDDIDVDGDALVFTGFTQPEYGSLVELPDGTLEYTPPSDPLLIDTFTYTIEEAEPFVVDHPTAESSTATCVIDFEYPPVAAATPVSQTVYYGEQIEPIIASATDRDGPALEATPTVFPAGIALVDESHETLLDGGRASRWTYGGSALATPGVYDVPVTITDGTRSDVTTVTIEILVADLEIEPSPFNPPAVIASKDSSASGAFGIDFTAVSPRVEGVPPGDLSNATATIVLTPLGPGIAATTTVTVAPDGTLTAAFDKIPLGQYDVSVTIGGEFYSAAETWPGMLVVRHAGTICAEAASSYIWPGSGLAKMRLSMHNSIAEARSALVVTRVGVDGIASTFEASALDTVILGRSTDAGGSYDWLWLSGRGSVWDSSGRTVEDCTFSSYIESRSTSKQNRFWISVVTKAGAPTAIDMGPNYLTDATRNIAWEYPPVLGRCTHAPALSDKIVRLAGSTRYETCIAASREGFPVGARAVVLATGTDFPDALSAGPLAAELGGPVLLLPDSGLTSAMTAEIKRLSPAEIFIIGGTNAVPASVDSELEALPGNPMIRRIAGKNRFDTAARVARLLDSRAPDVDTAFLVNGRGFADALAVAPIAAYVDGPILLVEADEVPAATRAVIKDLDLSPIVVGGTSVVSPETYASAGAVRRISGANRYATCAAILRYADSLSMTWQCPSVASGENFPDALVVGSFAPRYESVLILTPGDEIPFDSAVLLRDHKAEVRTVYVYGGTTAVSDECVAHVRQTLR